MSKSVAEKVSKRGQKRKSNILKIFLNNLPALITSITVTCYWILFTCIMQCCQLCSIRRLIDYVSDSGCPPHAVTVRLPWLVSGLPSQPSSVGPQRCSWVDRRSSSLRPHHRLSPVFTGYEHPSESSSSWWSWSADVCTVLQYTANMPTRASPVVDFWWPRRPSIAPCHCHGPFLCRRCSKTLEQSSHRRSVCLLFDNLS